MSRKSWFFAILIVTGMIGIVYFASFQAIMPAIRQQEQQEVHQNLSRSQKTIDIDLKYLSQMGQDWAFWDDTYHYASNPSQDYITNNLTNDTFKNLNINIIYITNLSGKKLFAKAVDLTSGQEVDLPSDLSQYFSPNSPFIPLLLKNNGLTGLLPLKAGTLSIAAYPIRNSVLTLEPDGIFMMGHFTNNQMSSEDMASSGILQNIYNLNMDLAQPDLAQQMRQFISSKQNESIRIINQEWISGFHIVQDIYGQPSIIIKIDQPRSSYLNWYQTITTFNIIMVITIVGFWLLALFFYIRLRHIQEKQQRVEEQLLLSEEKYQILAETTPDVIWEVNINGRFTYLNPRIKDILGYTPDELIGSNPLDLMVDNSRHEAKKTLNPSLLQGEPIHGLISSFRHKAGHEVILESNIIPVYDCQGQLVCFRGSDRDITERQLSLDLISQVEARYRQLVEQINAVTYIQVYEGKTSYYTYISPQIETLLGYKPQDWIQEPDYWIKLVHTDDRERVQAESQRTFATGDDFVVEFRMITRDGNIIWVHEEAVLSRELGISPQVWHGVMYDITDRKQLEEELRHIGSHDSLTGVYNRGFFNRQLEEIQNNNNNFFPISIIVGDMDNLKMINDYRGHSAGDQQLCRAAEVLLSCFRPQDIIARTGGDEFAILLPQTDEIAIQSVLKRLTETITRCNQDLTQAPILISLGAATGHKGENLDHVFNQADGLMYLQKQERKHNAAAL